jgi:hypothetical protein
MSFMGNTLLKILTMKNLILLLLALSLCACKKEEQAVNSLIYGLDPSIKLPKADTTNAYAYIQGYIDGEYFSLVKGKDSIDLTDRASEVFSNDYENLKRYEMTAPKGALAPTWIIEQPETMEKRWYINFSLPGYPLEKKGVGFKEFKKKYTTPSTYTNIGYSQDSSEFSRFNFEFHRVDYYDYGGKVSLNDFSISTFESDIQRAKTTQKDSYIKLLSVRYVPNAVFKYEIIYEFDVILTGGKHLTKGRMKTWLLDIKP